MGRTPYVADEETNIHTPATPIRNDKHDMSKKNGTRVVHPPDSGLHAWLFLTGSFLIEGLALGELSQQILEQVTRDSNVLVLSIERVSWCLRRLPGLLHHTPTISRCHRFTISFHQRHGTFQKKSQSTHTMPQLTYPRVSCTWACLLPWAFSDFHLD